MLPNKSRILEVAEALTLAVAIARVNFHFPGRILKAVSFREGLCLGISLSSTVPLA